MQMMSSRICRYMVKLCEGVMHYFLAKVILPFTKGAAGLL
jgi:hypothetical protein